MYKDKEKQRQAVRQATRRYRQRLKGITVSQDTHADVIPKCRAPYGDRCSCFKCQMNARDLAESRKVVVVPPEQSHNPMMVGYVPPKG